MSKSNIQKLQNESLKRLKLLKVPKETVQAIKKDFHIHATYISGIDGEISPVHRKALEEFEKRGIEGFPFYIIESFLNNSSLISILYVGYDEEEWNYVHNIIKDDKEHCAFVYNLDYPEYSAIGYVGLSIEDNVLYRIY